MKKQFGFLMMFLVALVLSTSTVRAQEPSTTTSTEEVKATAADNTPAVVAPVADVKVEFIGKENLADSLKAVLDVVNDPQIAQVINAAVETIKQKPEGKDPDSWFSWINAIIVTVTAALTLLLAKGRAIFGTLFRQSSN